jgi:hypothetical protein
MLRAILYSSLVRNSFTRLRICQSHLRRWGDCRRLRRCASTIAVGIVVAGVVVGTAQGAIVESINPLAIPATPEVPVFYSIFDNAGWYYTPSTSYALTGIYSNFGPNPSASGTNQITVQVQTDRPVKGGLVLAEATFDGENAVGGMLGASFDPIEVIAGETYFVNYLHLSGMGVNLGTWEEGEGGTPYPAGGATTNLGVYYRDDDNGFDTEVTDVWEVAAFGLARVSGAEPILFFEGIGVPEPSSVLLLAIGAGALSLRWRSEGRKKQLQRIAERGMSVVGD